MVGDQRLFVYNFSCETYKWRFLLLTGQICLISYTDFQNRDFKQGTQLMQSYWQNPKSNFKENILQTDKTCEIFIWKNFNTFVLFPKPRSNDYCTETRRVITKISHNGCFFVCSCLLGRSLFFPWNSQCDLRQFILTLKVIAFSWNSPKRFGFPSVKPSDVCFENFQEEKRRTRCSYQSEASEEAYWT